MSIGVHLCVGGGGCPHDSGCVRVLYVRGVGVFASDVSAHACRCVWGACASRRVHLWCVGCDVRVHLPGSSRVAPARGESLCVVVSACSSWLRAG